MSGAGTGTMPLDLDALDALLSAATPAPWREGSLEIEHVFVPNTHPEAMGPERVLLRMNEHFPFAVDARLIAELRNAAPELLRIAKAVMRYGEAKKAWSEWNSGTRKERAENPLIALSELDAVANEMARRP